MTKPNAPTINYEIKEIKWIAPSTFAKYLTAPSQRDHAARAKNKRALHLLTACPHFKDGTDNAHVPVDIAKTPDGKIYKVDGHTRSYIWEHGLGEASPPKKLLATIWDCANEESVNELYYRLDNSMAVETSADKYQGAIRKFGVQFQSPKLIKGHSVPSALGMAYHEFIGISDRAQKRNVYESFETLLPELRLLDQCKLVDAKSVHERWPSVMIAVALTIFAAKGKEAVPFWSDYSENRGHKEGASMDGTQLLSEMLAKKKAAHDLNDAASRSEVLRVSVKAYQLFSCQSMTDKLGGATPRLTREYLDMAKQNITERNEIV